LQQDYNMAENNLNNLQNIKTKRNPGENPAFNPYEIVRKVIFPFWPIYLITLIAAFVLGKVYIKFQVPLYQVVAKLLLKDDGGMESKILKEFDVFAAQKSVDNELEIIRSSNVSLDVVRNLNSYISIVQKGKLSSYTMPFNFPMRFEAINEDSLKPLPSVILKISNDKKYFFINNQKYLTKSQLLKIHGYDFYLNVDSSSLSSVSTETPYSISINSVYLSAVRLLSDLTAAQVGKKTTIIWVSYTNPSIENAKYVVNEILSVYTNAAVADKRKSAQFTINFIDERLNLINGELDSVERRIERFKKVNGIVNIGTQASLYLSSVKEIDTKLANINLQLSILTDIENYLNGKGTNPGSVPSVIGFNDPILLNLLPKLYDLESEISKRKKISGYKDEVYISLEEEIIKLKQSVRENIRNIRSNLNLSKIQTTDELTKQNGLLNDIPSKERLLVDISRQQSIKNEIYTFLLQKREESAISYAATVSDIRIIERAYGGYQVSPNSKLIYAMFFAMGILLPMLILYWRILLNPKIQYRNEIEHLTNTPVLGEIMFDDQGRTIVVGLKDRSIISESLRTIRTRLSYIMGDKPTKVILVSSSIPGEGKTFLSANLGVSYSLTGQKVLLIGGDMRKPTLHKLFNIHTRKGLSSYLSGALELSEVIVSTEYENLFLMPSGVIPPNPTELYESKQFSTMLEELKKQFGIIIIDSPPLGLVSDAELLAKYCDIALFVVRQGKTLKGAVTDVLDTAFNSNIFGSMAIVFNGIRPKGFGKYSTYGYSYGGYGYGGYGYYGNENKRTGFLHKIMKFFKRSK